MFDDFETKNFPVSVCVQQNPREKDVMDSNAVYLCVVVDCRWPTQCSMKHLRPYTAKDENGNLLYGWAGIDADEYVDHVDHSIHLDDARVVAWKRVGLRVVFGPSSWNDPEEV